jgi:UDP-N-acetylmuramoylalanine--D-glutamate ligase
MSWFFNRRVVVVGLGKSGTAAARLLHSLGARVSVTESSSGPAVEALRKTLPREVRRQTGGHGFLHGPWDLLVVSPGVPLSLWKPFHDRGRPVWGELELAYRVAVARGIWPDRTVAVTGTNGKTTTTALLGAMAEAAGLPTVVAGNIGTPLCERAPSLTRRSVLVLEVSSYQLESVWAFHPRVGALLNVTPDHLGRHGTMAGYARAKGRLFQNMVPGDTAVLNGGDPYCRSLARDTRARAAYFGARGLRDLPGGKPPRHLLGEHNRQNALAAVLCARALGVPGAAIARALAEFRGVPHRLETVAVKKGVRWINDSKATNVDSTLMALRAAPGPLQVILGGRDKGAPYAPLRPWVKKRARRVLLIGEASGKIARELSGPVRLEFCGDLETAVRRAAQGAREGEAVLLSPACASFDQFDNFEQRGDRFREWVADLPG